MEKEYDLIVSLGANCSAAANMKRRGLRRCSFPFDWLYMMDERPLLWLAEHLQDDFRDLCLKENLERITPESPEWSATDAKKFKYVDRESGYRFVHLFRRPVETSDEYERVYPMLRRRVDRLMRLIGRSRTVLLLLATGKSLSDAALQAAKTAFERRFQNVRFDMEFIKFDDAPFNEIKCVERTPASGIHVVEIPRAINEYDFSLTNFEWSFLDDVTMSAHVVEPGLKEKMILCAKKIVRWVRRVRNSRMI